MNEKRKFVIAAIVVLVVMAVVVANASASLCGDANDDGMIDMTDVMTMWYDIADYPYPGAYTISNVWAADVNCDDRLNLADVMTLWYDYANYPYPGAHEVNCCDDDNVLEYSVTIIEDYSDSPLGDLDPYGQESYDILEDVLHDCVHWTEKFHEVNDAVDEPDFGTSNSGYQGLDEADFHYHFGHGYEDWLLDPDAEICLHNWKPGYNIADVNADEVEYKWDEDNEWVIIHSCEVLKDHDDWGHALKYSHAVMGFETDVPMSPYVINNFLVQAIDYDMTVYQAYRRATKHAFNNPNIIAAAIFDTVEQMDNDHLWGQGVVMPDEYPDDNDYWYVSWTCDL